MIDHSGLAVTDIARSKAFFEAELAPLGYRVIQEARNDLGHHVVMMGADGEIDFVIADGERPGGGNHVAFRTDSRDKVQAFYTAALAARGKDNGAPGLRSQYSGSTMLRSCATPTGWTSERYSTRKRVDDVGPIGPPISRHGVGRMS